MSVWIHYFIDAAETPSEKSIVRALVRWMRQKETDERITDRIAVYRHKTLLTNICILRWLDLCILLFLDQRLVEKNGFHSLNTLYSEFRRTIFYRFMDLLPKEELVRKIASSMKRRFTFLYSLPWKNDGPEQLIPLLPTMGLPLEHTITMRK
jgi:hypothetical protein